MTLVIARRFQGNISLSSDSRVSFGSLGSIDFGIKIFSVPVKVYAPGEHSAGKAELVFNYQFGMAVAGNLTNAYTVKEAIYEILQNLQYIPGRADFSMDRFAKLIAVVFDKSTKDIASIIRGDGISEVIIAGYCPKNNKIRVFKFSCDTSNYPIRPFYKEIIDEDDIDFSGSGSTEARKIYAMQGNILPLRTIKQVIDSKLVKSVGGGLQYGEFVDNNFRIYGVEDYVLNDDGTFKEYLYTLRGMNLYKNEFEREDGDFHIAYKFKRPFERDINKLIDDMNDD